MSELFTEKLDVSEFEGATIAQWRAAAEATLKGKPLDKLSTRTSDGLTIDPIYQRDHFRALAGSENDPGVFPYIRGAKESAAWEIVTDGVTPLPRGCVEVDAHQIHEDGGTAVQEVAHAWAEGLKELRRGVTEGKSVDEAARCLRFTFAAGGEFFVALAKLRAARYGWARIVTASGGSPEVARMIIHARVSHWQQSSLDPHTNMLRSTVSACAAIFGGCNSLVVSPFDEVFREPDAFSRRLALNTQLILRDECHAAAVCDPAGGSWFVENLTREIAELAWADFQKSEVVDTAASAKAQRSSLSNRRRVMVGVNQYANPLEKPLAPTKSTATTRLAGHFENLRHNAWTYAEKHGGLPKVFLLTMGPLKQHKARADFVRGFLESGGFDVLYPTGFETASNAVRAARESGALAAVLCSTDETYPDLVSAVLAEMAGTMPVFLAGYPSGDVESFKSAGIADFIHLKADCSAFLTAWQKTLGIAL